MIFIDMETIKKVIIFLRRIFKIKVIVINCISKDTTGNITKFEGTDNGESFYLSKFKLIRRVIEYKKLGYEVKIKTFDNHSIAIVGNRYLTTVCRKGSSNHLYELPTID